MIRTNQDPFFWLPDWVPPAGEIFKATVVRARTFEEGKEPSKTVTKTFFVDSPANAENPERVGRWGRRFFGPRSRIRKTALIETVVHAGDATSLITQPGQMRKAHFGARHTPSAIAELLAFLPFRQRPNILSVCREGPRQPPHARRISSH